MRYPKVLVGSVIAALLAACSERPAAPGTASAPAEAVALVAPAERSAHFAAVTEKLELGGVLFGYVDIDGDMLKLAEGLHGLARQAAERQPMVAGFLPADFAPFFVELGLTDVKALGLSSVKAEGGGFRNSLFFHTPEGRRGLLAGLGGEPAEFAVAALAPADADLVYETELDAPAVWSAIRALVTRAAGEPMAEMLDAKLARPDPRSGLTGSEMLDTLKGRFSLVMRIDEARTFAPSPDLVLPAFDLALRHDRGGEKLAALLAGVPGVTREERADGVVAYVSEQAIPLIGWNPELLIVGDAFTLVSDPGFLATTGARLADDAGFRAALAGVGETGNGLTYVGPRLTERVARVAELNPGWPAEQRMAFERGLAMLPEAGMALVSVRRNLADGVLVRSQWSSSHKQSLVFANPGMVAGTGLMAAMAIPAFQKVRVSSQEKAVKNNLRQLAAARDQYFLENGVDTCAYADLVGAGPNHYIRKLEPVAGENYSALTFRNGEALSVELSDGRVVGYDY